MPYHVRKKLEEKQVEALDRSEITLRCKTCGSTWKPDMTGRKRLPKGYWRCPENCNEKIGEDETQTRMKVLLVDDDRSLTRSLAAILRSAGYIITTAHNGAEAIEASKNTAFEAVILDIKLPDIDGIELLKIIKAVDPIIGTLMLSGAATLEDAVETLNQGADAFILKPVDPDDLLNKLGTLTGFKSLERELREARARYSELYEIVRQE
jgi:CheY-like chemotaxis protein